MVPDWVSHRSDSRLVQESVVLRASQGTTALTTRSREMGITPAQSCKSSWLESNPQTLIFKRCCFGIYSTDEESVVKMIQQEIKLLTISNGLFGGYFNPRFSHRPLTSSFLDQPLVTIKKGLKIESCRLVLTIVLYSASEAQKEASKKCSMAHRVALVCSSTLSLLEWCGAAQHYLVACKSIAVKTLQIQSGACENIIKVRNLQLDHLRSSAAYRVRMDGWHS